MAGSRSFSSLSKAPVSANTPLYDPATAKQYQTGQVVPGLSIMSVMTQGGIEAQTGLKSGWAPQIGHIKTLAAQTKIKKTVKNPLTVSVGGTTKRKNPFFAESTPSPDSFGLNIPA